MEEIKEIIWYAPEFRYHPKTASWYWLSLLAAAALLLIALWQKNLLFLLFVAVAEATLIHWAKRQPRMLKFKISQNGIFAGETRFYPYEELEGFHILDEAGGFGELILKTKYKLNAYVRLEIADKDAEEIREQLKKVLNEIEYEESFSDSIGKIIGF